MLHPLKLGLVLTGALAVGACSVHTSTVANEDGAGGYGTSTSTGLTGGGTAEGDTFVGQRCEQGDGCGTHPGSFCVTANDTEPIFTSFWSSDITGGGVAGGYCTRHCDSESPCPDGSRCAGGVCLALCEFGAPDLTSVDADLDASKCHGRDDLMCVPSASGDSVCLPNCGAGDECGGRACDHRYGVCTDPDRSGALDGAQCTVDNATTEEDEDACGGLCLELTNSDQLAASVCTSRCSMGGSGKDCGGPEVGACVIPRVMDNSVQSQLGDVGFCASACEAHDGCNFASGMFCRDAGNYVAHGKGYCVLAESCENGRPCPDGELCVDTAGGEVCVDDDGTGLPLFPLGLAG